MIKKPDYTSNKINARKIYETPWHYSGSTIDNLNLGQYEVINTGRINHDHAKMGGKIMPNICDEHVWAQFQSGSNSQSGGTALADPSFASKAKANLVLAANGEFESNDTGWTTTNMTKSWNAEGLGSVGGYETCTIATSSATQVLTSPTIGIVTSLSGNDYYVYARFKFGTLASISDTYKIRIDDGSGGYQYEEDITFLLKDNLDNGGWFEFHGKFVSTTATTCNLELVKTGTTDAGTLLIDALEVYNIGNNVTIEVNSNIFVVGTGVVGGYFAFHKTSDATLKASPWELAQHTELDASKLWDTWWIGQITATGTGATAHQLSVRIGAVPSRGDWLKHFPKDGYAGLSIGTGELVNVYELAWWLRKGGLYMIQIHEGEIVSNINQHDSVTGSTYQTVTALSGQTYGEYRLQEAAHAFNDGQLSPGSEIYGKIKGIRAGLHMNPSASSGRITAYVAPDER